MSRGLADGWWRASLAVVLAAAVAGFPARSEAQLPVREALPWPLLETEASRRDLALDVARFSDTDSGWHAERFGVTAGWPRGQAGALFLRVGWFALDTADLLVTTRWPRLAVVGQTGWPGGSTATGWGSPEVGWLSALRLGALGECQYAVAAALPLGKDELYPFASTSLPVRCQLRKLATLRADITLAGMAGFVVALDSGRDRLQPDAYPGGSSAALEAVWRRAAGHLLTMGLAAEWGGGAHSLQPMIAWRFPSGASQALTVGVRRDCAGSGDRAYALQAWIAWSLRSESAPGSPSQNDVPPPKPARVPDA